MSKVVRALLGCKCLDELADQLHQRCHGASGTLAQRRLQLRECHFDRIEVRRVGRQIAHFGADRFDRLAYAVDLVGAQVIHEDDIAFAQRRHEHLLNIAKKRWSSRTVSMMANPALCSRSRRPRTGCALTTTARDRGVSERALSLLITDHGAERRDLPQSRSHVRSRTAADGSHPLRTWDIGQRRSAHAHSAAPRLLRSGLPALSWRAEARLASRYGRVTFCHPEISRLGLKRGPPALARP